MALRIVWPVIPYGIAGRFLLHARWEKIRRSNVHTAAVQMGKTGLFSAAFFAAPRPLKYRSYKQE